jgi:hypothetical protein
VGGFARRLLTLRTMGIAGAVVGAIALVARPAWDWLSPTPIATIDSPRTDARVQGCFVTRGHVVPGTIARPLWLIQAADHGRWHEIGRVDTAQATWGSRVCLGGEPGKRYRLALVLADRELDAEFSRLVHAAQPEEEIPEWLKETKYPEQQGGRGCSFPALPHGATPLSVVDVRLPGVPSYSVRM